MVNSDVSISKTPGRSRLSSSFLPTTTTDEWYEAVMQATYDLAKAIEQRDSAGYRKIASLMRYGLSTPGLIFV